MGKRLFEDKTTEEVVRLYREYEDLIFGANPCFGTKDIRILLELERELTLREEQP